MEICTRTKYCDVAEQTRVGRASTVGIPPTHDRGGKPTPKLPSPASCSCSSSTRATLSIVNFFMHGPIHPPPPPHNLFDAVIHLQECPPHKRFIVGCSSPFIRLAQHLSTLRAWCEQAMSAGSVKTRRAPSRHCRDAKVYGHTTATMHNTRVYGHTTTAMHTTTPPPIDFI